MTNSLTALRLLPWLSPEGKPCFLVPGEEGGIVSRFADATEARQLADGLDVLRAARRVLGDPLTPNVEVRYTALRLTECLADALRVAESRGRRLPSPESPEGGGADGWSVNGGAERCYSGLA
ncbi:hypothetical protein JL475_16515 [Streptomyces sp. M2CJ-2]|uniref:hypothetical protein n=1 Tax=Streptomyces sp. M2CJ-2 TaxID=2803948 RepID=UPI00192811C4|nr:hypothetical protein [Streptomyces sp. M2CJ-2]MBL3667560.1 hypothetical protein [Streptomyces sp. M2CJ-2]